MPTPIDRDEAQRLLHAGAYLVEVLPPQAYADAHLPGALNIPLQKLNHQTTAALQRDRAVIVYCYDLQ